MKTQMSSGSQNLSLARSNSLKDLVDEHAATVSADDSVDGDSAPEGGHHAAKQKSLLTAVPAAAINFLLMFGLCCAYGMIMFEDDFNSKHRGMAVKMNLCTACLVGLLYAGFSGIPVAIGGPDLNPVVFLGMFVNTIATELAAEHGLDYPGGRRLLAQCSAALFITDPVEFLRRLGSEKSNVEFCTGAHLETHVSECEIYHKQLAGTTVFTVAVASGLLGTLFFILGKFRLTRYVTYIPTNIVEAFLSCIGYKVFKYALKFCLYEPKQFIPAACVGVPMYFAKALHIGNPAIVIPVMLLIPLGIYYAVVFGQGGDLETAREAGWMFAPIENADFWNVWLIIGDINFNVWMKTLPTLPVMIIVVLLDCMLKLSATESKIPVRPEKDREMMLFGAGNILTTLTGSSVGYMQLKFNVINYGVMGNATDRRAGAIYAILCGICYFWSTDLINYMPRFFLSTLLFFAGAGFVAENLWGSRKSLTTADWLQILIILAIFIFTDSLLNAVIVGGLIAGATFIIRYARYKPIQGRPMRGGEISTITRRSPGMELAIENMSNHYVVVIRLKGFLFFASAQSLTQFLKTLVDEDKCQPQHKQLRWVVLECSLLDGMDSSASKAFTSLGKMVAEWKVKLVWSGMTKESQHELMARGTIQSGSCCFRTLEEAKSYTENNIVKDIKRLQGKWMNLHPWFETNFMLARKQAAMDPFRGILSTDAARFGCPWKYCSRREMTKFTTQLWKPGEFCSDLILVTSGRVGLFAELPEEGGVWQAPKYVYTQGWLINREAIMHRQTADYAICLDDGELIFWSETDWGRMSWERPHMTAAVLTAILRQESSHAASALQDTNLAVKTKEIDDLKSAKDCGRLHEDKLHWIHDAEIAEALYRHGFYNTVDDTKVEPLALPPGVLRDVEIAFYTFAAPRAAAREQPTSDSSMDAEDLSMDAEDLANTLSYAGLHGQLLAALKEKRFTKEEFLAICHEAALLRLDTAMEAKVRQIFGGYADEQGEVGRPELVKLFQEHFYSDIKLAEVNSIVDLYGTGRDGNVTSDGFLALMSRYLRRHEGDWRLLVGAASLLGKEAAEKGDKITAQHLVDHGGVDSLEAEELIWFANCCSSDTCNQVEGKPETLDYRLLRGLFFDPENSPHRLPPPPKSPPLEPASPGRPMIKGQAPPRKLSHAGAVVNFRALDRNTKPDAHRLYDDIGTEGPTGAEAAAEDLESVDKNLLPPKTFRQRVYQLFDEPTSSPAAQIWSLVMGLMILVSVFTLVLQPLITPMPEDRDIWWVFECYFTALFGAEFVIRFCVADAMGTRNQLDFIKTPMNICDLVAILPFFMDLAMSSNPDEFRLFRVFRFGRLARLLRLSRLARLGRLTSHHPAFAPIAVILVVIWGIYIRTSEEKK